MVIITYEANNLSTRRPIGSTLGKKEEEADKRRSELKTLLSGLEDSDTGTQPKHKERRSGVQLRSNPTTISGNDHDDGDGDV